METIKLARAGVLDVLLDWCTLTIGPEVIREAITEGVSRGHPAADELSARLPNFDRQVAEPAADRDDVVWQRLGAGEREAWQLYRSGRGELILSDDRAFLAALAVEEVPYLTSAGVVTVLVKEGVIPAAAGRAALDRLRPFIRQDQFEAAIDDIKAREDEGS